MDEFAMSEMLGSTERAAIKLSLERGRSQGGLCAEIGAL